MHDVRDLDSRMFWLMFSVVLGFASMFVLLWGITQLITQFGANDHSQTQDLDLPTIVAGSIVLTVAWYGLLQWLDHYVARRRARVDLARAWIATRKLGRAPRATI